MKKYIHLAILVLLCEIVGAAGTPFTASSIPTWYATLVKPALNPPNWVFGPVWTTLYAMMGVAIWLVLRHAETKKRCADYTWLFLTQLTFNFMWTMVFFGFKLPWVAFFVIVALWMLIAACIFRFYESSKLAAYLLIPYILWVSFAAYLNLSIALLN